jgi:hypothetical protein
MSLIIKSLKLFFIFTSFSVFLVGCAFGNRKIDLVYPPKDYAQYTPNASLSKRMGIDKIALVVMDKRSGDKKYLGEVRNGFYMHTADVVTDVNVENWVQKAFTQELQRSGFSVVKKESAQGVLTVVVDMVHCNAYWGYSADVQLRLQLVKGTKSSIVSKIEGFGSDGMNWGATGDAYTESLAKALADAYYQAGSRFLSPIKLP